MNMSKSITIDPETQKIVDQVLNSPVGCCVASRYIDRGASALVFEALKGEEKVALKVFDPVFMEKHGRDIEKDRINRQLTLKGKHHENLISILDGGQCDKTGFDFIIMPFLEAPSLDKDLENIPRNQIRTIISQIASAARFLEELELVHRDIKPSNIVIMPGADRGILLDLGVVRPLGVGEITDTTDTKVFVGTTRYSPPEFLIREEEDTVEGWRAVTFYQLGAVLHDLLTCHPIFCDKKVPYSRLVKAVLLEDPIFDGPGGPPDLIRLARTCLLKDPAKRLKLVTWDSFSDAPQSKLTTSELRERIQRARSAKLTQKSAEATPTATSRLAAKNKKQLALFLKQSCINDHDIFSPSEERHLSDNDFLLSFTASSRHGLDQKLHLFYRVQLIETNPYLFEISFAAAVGRVKKHDLLEIEVPLRTIHRGAYDSAAENSALNAAYSAFTIAMEESLLPEEPSAERSTLCWLDAESSYE